MRLMYLRGKFEELERENADLRARLEQTEARCTELEKIASGLVAFRDLVHASLGKWTSWDGAVRGAWSSLEELIKNARRLLFPVTAFGCHKESNGGEACKSWCGGTDCPTAISPTEESK